MRTDLLERQPCMCTSLLPLLDGTKSVPLIFLHLNLLTDAPHPAAIFSVKWCHREDFQKTGRMSTHSLEERLSHGERVVNC